MEAMLIPGTRSALIRTDHDRKHRPASHPLLGGHGPVPVTAPRIWDGALLRRRRIAMGWSQKQLAEAVGCSRVAVSSWEQGHVPSRVRRERVERLVGLRP